MRRLAFVLLLAACALAGCGGEEDQQGVENLLDQAFSQQIHSGDLKLNAEIDLDGLIDDPIRIEAEGPFHTNEGKLPSADIELRVGSGGGGQTITSGVLTTGDRVFVKFQDVYYEQPQAQVRRTNATIRKRGSGGQGLGQLGLDPRSWLADAKEEGDADVAGVKTWHVSGSLDVESLMRNLNKFVRRSAAALGTSTDGAAPRLTRADIRALADAVDNPTFDVYAGKQDNLIRRISARIEFEVPEQSRADLGGLKGGSIAFSVELSDVNAGDKQIEAPARSQPLSKLTDSLGGGALDGLGTGGGTRRGLSPEGATRERRRDAEASRSTPTASTRRAPRTPRSCSAARSCCSSPSRLDGRRRPAQVALGVDAPALARAARARHRAPSGRARPRPRGRASRP